MMVCLPFAGVVRCCWLANSSYLQVIVAWVQKHIFGKSPLITGSTVDGVADIEENVWMPLLGIKGKIDVTLKVM